MNRRDWWIGIVLLTIVSLTHALLPRYSFEIRDGREVGVAVYRIDRLTGTIDLFATGGAVPGWLHLPQPTTP